MRLLISDLTMAFCIAFRWPKPLARARPGHPRLEAGTISAPKTWMAGPSPATGILSGCTQLWPRNRLIGGKDETADRSGGLDGRFDPGRGRRRLRQFPR